METQEIIKRIDGWWNSQKDGELDEFDVGFVRIYSDDLNTLKKSFLKEVKVDEILKDIEERIKSCLIDTNKKKGKSMPPEMDWRAEALGYKTSLECIKRTREKFENI